MIHKDCADRWAEVSSNPGFAAAILNMFNITAKEGEEKLLPSSTLVLPLYDESCTLVPGDWAAEIHLVTRKVEHVERAVSEEQCDGPAEEEGDA